jgi:hypothetical protein
MSEEHEVPVNVNAEMKAALDEALSVITSLETKLAEIPDPEIAEKLLEAANAKIVELEAALAAKAVPFAAPKASVSLNVDPKAPHTVFDEQLEAVRAEHDAYWRSKR